METTADGQEGWWLEHGGEKEMESHGLEDEFGNTGTMKLTPVLPGMGIFPGHPCQNLAPGMWNGGQQSLGTGSEKPLDEALPLQMRTLRSRELCVFFKPHKL